MPQASRGNPDQTPAMRQFHHFKKQYPECVLFFRIGDFYETFYDDAKLAHKVLGVTLTQRMEGVPMAGVPFHAVEGYLRRMIQAGYRVAVCDQVQDPAQAKGVVDREVTRVITPGTLTDETLLEEGQENPLAGIVWDKGSGSRVQGPGSEGGDASVAWVELSTGVFRVARFAAEEVADELARIAPRELLYVDDDSGTVPPEVKALAKGLGCVCTARPGWQFDVQEAAAALKRQYQVATLAGFGLAENDAVLRPAGAVLHYLLETQKQGDGQGRGRLGHLRPPKWYRPSDGLVVDQTTLRNLEVERTIRSGGTEGSLLGVMSDCVTAMGKRMLRQWLCYPLATIEAIEQRQRAVAALVGDSRMLNELREVLDRIHDVERMAARIALGRATPRDLVGLGGSGQEALRLAELLAGFAKGGGLKPQYDVLAEVSAALAELGQTLQRAVVESPPLHLREGGVIRDGYDAELDGLRGLQRDSHGWLAAYQKELIEQTGITSLKVGYNQVFGYYIELTAANKDKAPAEWSRRQTLKNAERFITPQLKEFETKVLSAQSRAIAREQAVFGQLCALAAGRTAELARFGQAVGELDVLACWARLAVRRRYVKPTMVAEPVLQIKGGRHPVLDQVLAERFVPNDVALGSRQASGEATQRPSDEGATLALITGPNMAGKSTYIRQTALIVLLAHTGSFVPAEEATIGLCDRIFARVGASDELHAGQSTFMVEMTETANICHHATRGSLVILDEIGRGTSTLDGLALAWAIAEFLAQKGCRTLFATHYHEITQLSERYANVANFNVTVREWQDQIVFLHRIVPGAADKSYGIHVAKLAGLPAGVVKRASEVLAQLEVTHEGERPPEASAKGIRGAGAGVGETGQMGLFTQYVVHPAVEELRRADLESLSPLAAFDLLRRVRAQLEDGEKKARG